MKYVRTKDGKILERATFTINHTKYIGSIGNANLYQDNDIVKQADTIKELCDRFVLRGIDVIILNKDNTQYRFEAETKWHDITDTQIRIGVYGAIWTDKGLIYVAKMNNKGKLELLEA